MLHRDLHQASSKQLTLQGGSSSSRNDRGRVLGREEEEMDTVEDAKGMEVSMEDDDAEESSERYHL